MSFAKLRSEAEKLSQSTANDELRQLGGIVAALAKLCGQQVEELSSYRDENTSSGKRSGEVERDFRERIELLEMQIQKLVR